jgi:hypothetical protein
VVQSGRPQFEVALFGQACGHLRRPEVGLAGGGGVAGLIEQVGLYPFEAVGVCHPLVGVEGAEQGESGGARVKTSASHRHRNQPDTS